MVSYHIVETSTIWESDGMESSNYLLMNISILYRCGQKFYDKQLSEYGITAGQLPFLILIYENEGISMQELAVKGCFDKGTVTKGVQKLEDQGFVNAQSSSEDKRVRCLYTTDKTKSIISHIYLVRREWWDRLTQDMSDIEITQLESNLDHLTEKGRLYDSTVDHDVKLFGLQKLTLLDYPQKMASTVFTGGCNFRCPFCQNADLVFLPENTSQIPTNDILSFLKKRKNVLEGVCITGGEPLLNSGLEFFLSAIKEMGYNIKLDTNGSFPERLKELVDKNLIDYVAMDVKNSPARYAETIGIQSFDMEPIQKSICYLLENHVPYEFRTTVVKEFHSEEDLLTIAQMLKGARAYYLQNFEDSARVIRPGLHAYEQEELIGFVEKIKEFIPDTHLRGL